MGFELFIDRHQLREHIRHHFFHARQIAAFGFASDGQRLRGANASDHILALRVHQKLAIE